MCGIGGVVSFDPARQVDAAVLHDMGRVMLHRGPDDEGYYQDGNCGLAMRRLSIIDPATGQQPMSNEEGTVWLVCNGEIYNYLALRAELIGRGHSFKSRSDSEVIVHAYEEYGERCPEYLNGMFAFAIWDTKQRRLLLARDHLGIKPLYYWTTGDRIVFGSELSTVRVHPDAPRRVDPISLDHFLALEYIPSPRTILDGVRKLPAGHRLLFHEGGLSTERYWDAPSCDVPNGEAECAEILAELIGDAVKMQLVSDVPLGAFLSGGIDSSTVVAFMSQASSLPVQTFSIGFGDSTYNELPYARAVANQFGTHHHEEFLEPEIADLALQLAGHLDEPLADFSIFPTYLVSKVARQSVKVALSGDGGDELFGGYESYLAQHLDRRYYAKLPAWLRQKAMPALLAQVRPRPAKRGLINKTKRFVEGAALPSSLQHTRWMTFLDDGGRAELYRPELRAALDGASTASAIESVFRSAAGRDPLAQQQYVDIKTYLVDDILTKVDRMSMANSLEARVPLLDRRIVEFALSLPPHFKLDGGHTKVILRRLMADRLPAIVLNKPKQGFSIPLKHWLCGPLRPLMTDLLSASTVARRGYFEPTCVERWMSEHLAGRVNHSHRLWALMVLELWQQRTLEGEQLVDPLANVPIATATTAFRSGSV